MTSESLAERSIFSLSGVPSHRVEANEISEAESAKLVSAVNQLGKAPLTIIDQSTLTISQIRSRAIRLHRKKPLSLIVVDYLQLVSQRSQETARQEVIAEISRGLKLLSRELNVPVLALCQLNRESEKMERKPRLSDLRESGSIEQDADKILLLYRPGDSVPHPTRPFPVSCIVAKHRNGPIGEVEFMFNPGCCRFDLKSHASIAEQY